MIKRGKTVIAIPPGETIREFMVDHEINRSDLRQRMEMTEGELDLLLDGETEITEGIAERLEKVFGLRAGFWLDLERIYRDDLKEVEEESKDG